MDLCRVLLGTCRVGRASSRHARPIWSEYGKVLDKHSLNLGGRAKVVAPFFTREIKHAHQRVQHRQLGRT